jgi:hypothetical protein
LSATPAFALNTREFVEFAFGVIRGVRRAYVYRTRCASFS